MTVPYLMNCAHSTDGWCLPCVARLGNALQEAIEEVKEHNVEYRAITPEKMIGRWKDALSGKESK